MPLKSAEVEIWSQLVLPAEGVGLRLMRRDFSSSYNSEPCMLDDRVHEREMQQKRGPQ